MGGLIGRPLSKPICLPLRMAFRKFSSFQAPIPVAESEVRLAEYDMPQGPMNAVRSGLNWIQFPGFKPSPFICGSCASDGWPDNMRDESTCGPVGVIIFGE